MINGIHCHHIGVSPVTELNKNKDLKSRCVSFCDVGHFIQDLDLQPHMEEEVGRTGKNEMRIVNST